jgi:hypothetical protein
MAFIAMLDENRSDLLFKEHNGILIQNVIAEQWSRESIQKRSA